MTDELIFFVILLVIVACCIIAGIVNTKRRYSTGTVSKSPSINPSYIVFIIVFVLEMVAGYLINHVNQMLMVDALSRTANAFYVWNIDPPHLAAIGFVWPPLPSFLQLPLLGLWTLFKPLATSALAGTIVTSIFTAAGAALIYNCCRHFEVSKWASILLVALYSLNPFIFVYGFNGMSEAVFIFTIVWVVTEFVQWIEDEVPVHLMWMGIALALGFLTRYEAVPFAVALFFAVLFYTLKRRKVKNGEGHSYPFFEGTIVVLFTPLAATVVLWMAANYVIMGDALYFLTSQYSNEAYFSYVSFPNLVEMAGQPLPVLEYIGARFAIFAVLSGVILIIRLLSRRLFKWETLMLLALVISIPVFQYIMLFRGTSYGWLRFFVYPLPIAVAWIPLEFKYLKNNHKLCQNLAIGLSSTALIASGVMAGMAMNSIEWGYEEYSAYRMENTDLAEQKKVAEYINDNLEDSTVLMDSFRTWYVIVNLESTSKIITSASLDFATAVENPIEQGVDYLIATIPSGTGVADALNIAYPGIFYNGAEWCRLVYDFGDYRLYQVIR